MIAGLRTILRGLREMFAPWWMRVVGVLLILLLVLRLFLGSLLERTVNEIAAEYRLICQWDELDMNLLAGRVELHGLRVRELLDDGTPSTDPLVDVDYAVVDIDFLRLLGGKLRIARAVVEGMDSWWVRDEDGRWNVLEHLGAARSLGVVEDAPEREAEEDEEAESGGPRPLDLSPPLAIGALRCQQARFHLRDRYAKEPVELDVELGVALSFLDDPERPLEFSVSLLGGELLNALHLTGDARWNEDHLRLTMEARAGAADLHLLAPYLEPHGIRAEAEALQAHARAELDVEVIGEARDAVRMNATITEVSLLADTLEAMALDSLTVEVEELSARGATLPGIRIEGVRGRPTLEADGSVRMAGLRFGGRAWREALAATEPQPSGTPAPAPAPAPAPEPAVAAADEGSHWFSLLERDDPHAIPWVLGGVEISGGIFDLTDRTVEPAARFPVYLDRMSIGRIAHVPGQLEPVPLIAEMRAPGTAEALVLHGAVQPFAPERSVGLELRIEDVHLQELASHLKRSGYGTRLEHGTFTLTASGAATTDERGRTAGWLTVDGVVLEDDGELFGVRTIRGEGLLADPVARVLRADSIKIDGARLSVGFDASRRFFAFGLQSLGIRTSDVPAPEQTPAPTPPRPQAAPDAAPPWRIELGNFAWTDNALEFIDLSVTPARVYRAEDLSVELQGLTLGGDPAGGAHEPARFSTRLRAPGMVDSLVIDGVLRTQPGPVRLGLDLALQMEGAQGNLLRPTLEEVGMDLDFDAGRLAFALYAEVQRRDAGWDADLEIRGLDWADGERPLLACRELRVDGVHLPDAGARDAEGRPVTTRIAGVSAAGLRMDARREADGSLVFAGVRMLPSDAAPADAEGEANTPAPSADAAPRSPLPVVQLPELPEILLQRFSIEELKLGWTDASFEPPLESELELDLSLDGLRTDGTPGALHTRIGIPGTLERLEVDGALSLAPGRLSLEAGLEVEGIAAGPLARMLPPEIELRTDGALLKTSVAVELGEAAGGGARAAVRLGETRWGRPGGEPWLALDAAEFAIPRADAAAGVLLVGPLTVDGIVGECTLMADGSTELLGVRLLPRVESPEDAEAAAETTGVEAEGAAAVEGADDPATEVAGVGRLLLDRLEFVDAVRLDVKRLRLQGEDLLDGQPLDTRLRITLDTPFRVLDADPAALPPIDWRLEAGIEGVVESLALAGQLAPYAAEPRFSATLDAQGIDLRGLTSRLPESRDWLQGSATSAALRGELEGTLYVRRARPDELGLSRPFGAEVQLRGLELRNTSAGKLLAGVDQMQAEVGRIDLARGLVHVDMLEIDTPRLILTRKEQTIWTCGLRYDGAKRAELEQAAAAAAEAAAAEESAATPPTSEVRIDQLVVSGLDFQVRDTSGENPVEFALDGVDVEVKRFTTRAFHEPRAMQYSAYLRTSSQVGDRPAFEEVATTGRLMFYPELRGWAQLTLSAFELRSIAPIAATNGVEVEDGALDASMRLRMPGDGTTRVDTSLVFTDLNVHEGPGGFLESVFSLPTTLDSALFLLRNADGEHRFSANFTVDADGLGSGAVRNAAIKAFAEVFTRALAGVPLRLLGTIAPPGEPERETRQSWDVAFRPGSAVTVHDVASRIREAGKELGRAKSYVLVLRHELTEEDVARARRLANPPRATCREIAAGLRQRKAELVHRQAEVRAEVVNQFKLGDESAQLTAGSLRGIYHELAEVELGLDRILEILRSDSPRQRQKRTRATARKIGTARMEMLREMLQRELGDKKELRIEVRPPRFEVVEGIGGGGRVLLELRAR